MAAGDKKLIALVNSTIPQALKETGRRIAADPSTRDLLMTDRASVKIATGLDGKVSLVTAYTTHFILKEFIEHGRMYFLPSFVVNAAQVSVADNTLTHATERVKAGDKVQITTGGTIPAGITASVDYYVIADSDSTGAFQIASSRALAAAGTPVDITSQGVGNHTVTVMETADFPLQRLADPSTAPFPRYLDEMFRYYFIQGDTLQLLPYSSSGSVGFSVPYYPSSLANLPDSAEAENIFIETLLQILDRGVGSVAG